MEVEADSEKEATEIVQDMANRFQYDNLIIELEGEDGKLIKADVYKTILLDGELGGNLNQAIRAFYAVKKQNYYDARKEQFFISEN
ncbi:hypothetical protein D1872_212880 [compost metagenome]